MNSLPGFRLGQLPGLFRTCVRHASTYKGPTVKGKGYDLPEGHGEKIWVLSHRKSNQIIYSFKEQLKGNHHLDQIPFNGKKLKPAKLRKDYWYTMATIEFPPGQGAVGRSVYQKLRELKHLHEVSWSDEIRYKRPDEYSDKEKVLAKKASEEGREFKVIRTRIQRGQALNAQKPFSIADMAVVLAGQGSGNKLVKDEVAGVKQLVDVTVRWANDEDKKNASEWSSNVTHELFEEPAYVSGNVEAAPEVPVPNTN